MGFNRISMKESDSIFEKEDTEVWPDWYAKTFGCHHPEHRPPMHLYIPSGKTYTHTCPGCGKKIILRGQNIRYWYH